jgi:hypothetical protein
MNEVDQWIEDQHKDIMKDVPTATETAAVPSPFLPGTNIQYAWDSTSLALIKECPRKYQYKMIDGWQKEEENVHLRFGIEYHRALQDYDIERAADIPHDDAVHDVVRAALIRTGDWRSDHKYKNRNYLIRSILWYLDHFHDDPSQTFIMNDGKPAVEVSFRFELDWGPDEFIKDEPFTNNTLGERGQPYLLCGHLDRVVLFHDDLFVMDRKTTTTTLSDYYFAQFEPSNQMTLYTLGSRIIFDSPVKGVIIDAAQVMIEGTRFVRSMTYRTQDQLDEWLADLRYWLAKAEEYAQANYWPMNDTACRMCEFRGICSKSPQVREKFLASDFKKVEPDQRWNPLKQR